MTKTIATMRDIELFVASNRAISEGAGLDNPYRTERLRRRAAITHAGWLAEIEAMPPRTDSVPGCACCE